MRLPWWPIYLDARFDESGVYFLLGEKPERFVPWHLVHIIGGRTLAVYDESGEQIRERRSQVLLRVPRGASADALASQHACLSDPHTRFTFRVDRGAYSQSLPGMVSIAILTLVFPAALMAGLIQTYMTAPQNDPGERLRIGLLLAMILLGLGMLFINWWLLKSLKKRRAAKKVIAIDETGILAEDNGPAPARYRWASIESIEEGFAGHLATTDTGTRLLFPQSTHACSLARFKCASKFRMNNRLIIIALCIAFLSGPIVWAWYTYLLPTESLPQSAWAISFLATSQILLIVGLVYLSVYLEKRRAAHSKE